jgi:hypothetical protein
MYDVFNNDLCGNSYKSLEKKLGLEVEIIWWIIELVGEK